MAAMRRLLTTALCLLALPALADSRLRGHWRVQAPGLPDYQGVVLVDRAGRATWDSPNDRGKVVHFFGYVASDDGVKVEIPFTNRERVTRMHCTRQKSDLLHCYNVFHNGTPSDGFMLVKEGPGPASLMPAPR
jgi:hypothetical protein